MNITVYSTPTCPFCHMVKDYLKQHKIEFKDVNVAEDHKAAMEMIRKSGQQGVPVTDVDGKIIVGFDREALNLALKLG